MLSFILLSSLVSVNANFIEGVYAGSIHRDAQSTTCTASMCIEKPRHMETAFAGNSVYYADAFQKTHEVADGWGFEVKSQQMLAQGQMTTITQHGFVQSGDNIYVSMFMTYIVEQTGQPSFACTCAYEGQLVRTGPIK